MAETRQQLLLGCGEVDNIRVRGGGKGDVEDDREWISARVSPWMKKMMSKDECWVLETFTGDEGDGYRR